MVTKSPFRRHVLAAAVLGAWALSPVEAAAGPIDVQHSKLTVFVYKAGLFSALADNHVINAPIASGTIATGSSPAIELVVNAADLVPLDPDLDPAKRSEVRTRMLGAEVLDTARFPTIKFVSTAIEPAGPDRWNVTGNLTIHGVSRAVTFPVVRSDGRYRGETRIRQTGFGIKPIRIAGGTVSVKDELKIEFEIAATDEHAESGTDEYSTAATEEHRTTQHDLCSSLSAVACVPLYFPWPKPVFFCG
jgi:YceI-like domain